MRPLPIQPFVAGQSPRHPLEPAPALGYLGQVSDMTAQTTPQLPSSESVVSALRGEKNGWGKVVISTGLRAVLIMPGLALAGARGRNLIWGSLLSSTTITAFIFFFYSAKCDGTYATRGAP